MSKLKKLIDSLDDPRCKHIAEYKPGLKITTHDKMADYSSYTYELKARYGKDFRPDFTPAFTPAEMLKAGVFEGKYMNDLFYEFPKEWYKDAIRAGKLSPDKANPEINCYKVKSRKSLSYWREKGWILITETHNVDNVIKKLGLTSILKKDITDYDCRGWFQWYCRYYIGRRQPIIDDIQINRWRAFGRHQAQLRKNCGNNLACRPVQRQALLQWSRGGTASPPLKPHPAF
jgi:hypothetical protein